MRNGWIYLHRKIIDNEMWLSEKFTKAQAWVDMLFLANFKDSMFFLRGNEIRVKRGQIAWSEDKIAKRWKWSRGKVRRYLVWLADETRQQIIQHKSPILNVIEIVNYNELQPNGTTDSTTDGQQTDNRRTHKNKGKEKIIKDNKDKYIEFVFLTKEEHEKLIDKFGESGTADKIENLNNYVGSKGNKYVSHYHTILSWDRKEKKVVI